jgi:hypothetical protein
MIYELKITNTTHDSQFYAHLEATVGYPNPIGARVRCTMTSFKQVFYGQEPNITDLIDELCDLIEKHDDSVTIILDRKQAASACKKIYEDYLAENTYEKREARIKGLKDV